jgi:hypothetical protein
MMSAVALGVMADTFFSDMEIKVEARAGIEPAIELLQSSALPLGYRAD